MRIKSVSLLTLVAVSILLVAAAPAGAVAVTPANAHPASWSWSGYPQYKAGSTWILESPNAVFTLKWQSDNNWVLYRGGTHAEWSTHTNGTDDNYLQFAPDGFIDVGTYRNPGYPYFCGWQNHVVTQKNYSWTISVTNTGDVQEKRSDGVLYWHTDGSGGTAYGPCSKG